MDVLLKRYFWLVNLVVVATCGLLGGRAATHLIEAAYLITGNDDARMLRRAPPIAPPAKLHGKESAAIVSRDLFCSNCAPAAPSPSPGGEPVVQSNAPVKSALNLELVSTMVSLTDDQWSMAVVRDLSTKEKDPDLFARGKQLFATGATVIKVVPKRVYFRNQGRLEYIELDGTAPPPAAAAATPVLAAAEPGDINGGITCTNNNCVVDRALVDKLLTNMNMLATSARFVPTPKGFKVYAIRPNSIFGKMGLQNGDTIKAINGNDMTTLDAAMALFSKLRNASHLSVQVERHNDTVPLDYTIR